MEDGSGSFLGANQRARPSVATSLSTTPPEEPWQSKTLREEPKLQTRPRKSSSAPSTPNQTSWKRASVLVKEGMDFISSYIHLDTHI